MKQTDLSYLDSNRNHWMVAYWVGRGSTEWQMVLLFSCLSFEVLSWTVLWLALLGSMVLYPQLWENLLVGSLYLVCLGRDGIKGVSQSNLEAINRRRVSGHLKAELCFDKRNILAQVAAAWVRSQVSLNLNSGLCQLSFSIYKIYLFI